MFKGFYNLTSGMLTHGRNLNVISNNIANVATTGYKADTFTAQPFDIEMYSRVGNKDKQYIDIGEQSYITAPSQLYTDYSQESFDATGEPLDFAIEGEGWFAVQAEEGRFYTRAGSFSLDEEGYLTLPGLGRVLDEAGNEIFLMTDKLQCDNFGNIYSEQDGLFVAKLGVFTFADGQQPEKNALGMFATDAQPQNAVAVVHNGLLERSNVDWVQQMVRMISAQRAYQSAAQVTKIYDQLMTKSTTELGRM